MHVLLGPDTPRVGYRVELSVQGSRLGPGHEALIRRMRGAAAFLPIGTDPPGTGVVTGGCAGARQESAVRILREYEQASAGADCDGPHGRFLRSAREVKPTWKIEAHIGLQ